MAKKKLKKKKVRHGDRGGFDDSDVCQAVA